MVGLIFKKVCWMVGCAEEKLLSLSATQQSFVDARSMIEILWVMS